MSNYCVIFQLHKKKTFPNLFHKKLTKIDGVHGNRSSIFTVAFLIQQNRWRSTATCWGMKSVKVTDMSPELLDGSSTECVTCSNHHTETIVKQPKADLQTQIEKKKEEKKAAFSDLFSPILHNSAFSQMAGWKTF